MPIPNLPEFHEILSEMRLATRKPSDPDTCVQIPFLPAVDEHGPVNQESLWLQYPAGTKLPFKRLLERINKELQASHHSRHDDFVLFVLALAALMPSHRGDIVSRLNYVLDTTCDAEVTLYHILAAEFPERYQFEIPPFTIGPLRTEKLAYNCQKAKSDFYSRYRESMAQTWTIERKPMAVPILDIPRIRETIFGASIDRFVRSPSDMQAWELIVNGYFSLQNTVLFEEFQTEMVSAQSALLALGSPFFDPRPLQMLSSVIRTHRVAIFLNIGADKEGFVAPGGMGPLIIELGGINERVPLLIKELRQCYGFERFDDSPLHRSIKLFADFVARGRQHELENWINAIYDVRSKYVHAGTDIVDESQLQQLRNLCQQVFRCLMRLQKGHSSPPSRGEETMTKWLRELDYLAKGVIAGKQPTASQFAEAFIA